VGLLAAGQGQLEVRHAHAPAGQASAPGKPQRDCEDTYGQDAAATWQRTPIAIRDKGENQCSTHVDPTGGRSPCAVWPPSSSALPCSSGPASACRCSSPCSASTPSSRVLAPWARRSSPAKPTYAGGPWPWSAC